MFYNFIKLNVLAMQWCFFGDEILGIELHFDIKYFSLKIGISFEFWMQNKVKFWYLKYNNRPSTIVIKCHEMSKNIIYKRLTAHKCFYCIDLPTHKINDVFIMGQSQMKRLNVKGNFCELSVCILIAILLKFTEQLNFLRME